MNYQYSYLIGTLMLLLIWGILFFLRKDLRKKIWRFSFVFGIAGLLVQPIYLGDWWHPINITNTSIGIEDFLFGFAIGGIGASIYSVIFNKKYSDKKYREENVKILGPIVLALFFISFYYLKNSFYSTMISFSVPILIIWFKRKDLIVNSILSGILLALSSFLAFIVPEKITPGWVESAWNFENITKVIIFKMPLDDFLWFIIAGMLIGPIYEYEKGLQVTKNFKNYNF